MAPTLSQVVRREKNLLIGTIVVLVVGGLGLLDPEMRSFLNSNEGAASALLTLMLVLLYLGQYRLLDRQVRLENRPHLVVEEYDKDGNKILAQLSNLGNGVAGNIELETTIDFEGGGPFSPGTGRKTMRKVGEEGDEKRRVGNALEVGRTHELFVADAVTGLVFDGEMQGYGLRAATGRLAMEGVETVTVDFTIVNRDMIGNEYRATIFGAPYKMDLRDGGMGVEDVVNYGSWDVPDWDDA